MRKPEYTKYIYAGITACAVIAAGIAMIFVMFRRKELVSGLNVIKVILQPVIIGCVIAYLLTPLCSRYEKLFSRLCRKKPRLKRMAPSFAVAASAVSALIVVAILVGLIVPNTIASIVSLVMAIPDFVMNFIGWANEKLTDYPEIKKYLLTMFDNLYDKFDSWTQTQIMPSIQTFLTGVGSSISLIFSLVLNVVVGFIVSIYLLASRKIFSRQAKMLLYAIFKPKAANMIFAEMKYADRMFSGFIRGQALDSCIVGIICFIFLRIMNYPNFMLISVIVGVTNMIPFFGPFIGAIPSALLILATDPKKCIYFVIFILVLQQIDGNVICPKCMGSTTDLSAFWVLFAILLFGGLWGVVGMVIAVPLFAVIYDIIKKIVHHMLDKHGIRELVDKPPEEDPPPEKEDEKKPAEQTAAAKT